MLWFRLWWLVGGVVCGGGTCNKRKNQEIGVNVSATIIREVDVTMVNAVVVKVVSAVIATVVRKVGAPMVQCC